MEIWTFALKELRIISSSNVKHSHYLLTLMQIVGQSFGLHNSIAAFSWRCEVDLNSKKTNERKEKHKMPLYRSPNITEQTEAWHVTVAAIIWHQYTLSDMGDSTMRWGYNVFSYKLVISGLQEAWITLTSCF